MKTYRRLMAWANDTREYTLDDYTIGLLRVGGPILAAMAAALLLIE